MCFTVWLCKHMCFCCVGLRSCKAKKKKKKSIQDLLKLILLPNSLCYQAPPVSVALFLSPFLPIPSWVALLAREAEAFANKVRVLSLRFQ